MSPRTAPAALVVLALCLGGASAAGGQGGDLVTRVEAALDDVRGVDADDLQVSAEGTEISLGGEVETFWVKTRAIEAALAVDGVETVASELQVPEVESDDEIAADVGAAIQTYRYNTLWDFVGGQVVDGVVTLTGSVTPDRDKPAELFERVAKIRGVQDVQLQIHQQSASRRDRDLRIRIANRVRRHPTFSQYQILPQPPFRILVDEGIVTLVGSVRGETERQLLESIARQEFEAVEVRNLLQTP